VKKLGPINLGIRLGVSSRGGERLPIEEQEANLILQALQQGIRARKVAETFGRNEGAIRYVAKKAGLKLAETSSRSVKKQRKLTLSLSAPAIELLQAAAKRRSVSVEDLTAKVVTSVLMRGVLDHPPDLHGSLRMAARYEVETDDDEIALSEAGESSRV
jgi:hypothetical protein